MPAIANIVLNDGKSTPVAHTFTPQTGQVAVEPSLLFNKAAGIFVGFEKLTALVRRSESNKTTRVSIQISQPTLAVTAPSTGSGIQPNPTVAYTTIGKIDFVLPDSCTYQDRKDIRVLLSNALLNAVLLDAIDNMAPVY